MVCVCVLRSGMCGLGLVGEGPTGRRSSLALLEDKVRVENEELDFVDPAALVLVGGVELRVDKRLQLVGAQAEAALGDHVLRGTAQKNFCKKQNDFR